MKTLKKMLFTVMLGCLLFGIIPDVTVLAANGRIAFTDLTVKEGETAKITVKVTSDSKIGSVELDLTYDSSLLEFVEGSSAANSSGKITIEQSGADADTLTYTLKMKALKSGNATIKVADQTIKDTSDKTIAIDRVGSSAIKIQSASSNGTSNETDKITDGNAEISGVTVEVGDKVLGFVEKLPSDAGLTGYTKSTLSYQGVEAEALKSDYTDVYIVYLADAAGAADYYVYNEKLDKFSEFILLKGVNDKFIVVLEGEGPNLKEYGFAETSIFISDKEVVVWGYLPELIQLSPAAAEYFVVYGLNNEGLMAWYIYDTTEGIYQRFFSQPPALIEDVKGSTLSLTEQEEQIKQLNDSIIEIKSSRMTIIVILAVIVLILVFLLLNTFLKVRALKEELLFQDEEEDDFASGEEEDNEEDEIIPSYQEEEEDDTFPEEDSFLFKKTSRREKPKKTKKSISKENFEEESDDDDDEFDFEIVDLEDDDF